jgi:sugar phosphate permease
MRHVWGAPPAQDKGVENAAVQVSGLELGGLAGSLSSGAISDYLVRNNDGSKGNVGLRVQVLPCLPSGQSSLPPPT